MITKIDLTVLDYIQKIFKCDTLDFILPMITKLADHGIVPIIIAILLIPFVKTRKIGVSMGISYILGGVVGNLILKNLTQRIRPYDVVGTVDLLIPKLSDYSFPSGHTLIAFECAVVLLLLLKGRKRIISISALVVAFIIAFSRLYLFVHYPTDVICGIVLGGLFAYLGVKIADIIYDRISDAIAVKKESDT